MFLYVYIFSRVKIRDLRGYYEEMLAILILQNLSIINNINLTNVF